MNPIEALLGPIIQAIGDFDNIDAINDCINSIEKFHVLLIVMAALKIAKDHEGHDNCEPLEKLPEYIKLCKTDFIEQLDLHLEMNLALNGVTLAKTHNEKVADKIMKDLDKGNM